VGFIGRLLQEWYVARHQRENAMNEIIAVVERKDVAPKTLQSGANDGSKRGA